MPDFKFYVFDAVLPGVEFDERSDFAAEQVRRVKRDYLDTRAERVPQARVVNLAALEHYEAAFLKDGYEGMMVRAYDGHYKYGRSTEREGGLVKVKRFVDAEAVVVGFVEEMENTNEAKRDALGNTERSTAKAGLVGKGTLGALVVRDEEGREFNVGTGFKAIERAYMWEYRETLLGKHVTYKYFDHGIKEAPRHPVFKAFRAPEDMSK
jgi:DNA ligase-1